MEIGETIFIPVILGVVEIAKGFGLPSKYASLLSVVLGIGLMLLAVGDASIRTNILQGVVYGLSASGLYSGSKGFLKK